MASRNSTPAVLPWTTGAHSGRGEGQPPAHPVWRRENATPAMPWTPVVHSGRAQGPPPGCPSG
eukprot:2124414-Pyramimonas_sp.AAC.1